MKTNPNSWLPVLILTMTGLVAGCTLQTVPPALIQTPLPLPIRPVLPTIPASDLVCLSDAVYAQLATRNRLLRQYAETLETIIQATRLTGAEPHGR